MTDLWQSGDDTTEEKEFIFHFSHLSASFSSSFLLSLLTPFTPYPSSFQLPQSFLTPPPYSSSPSLLLLVSDALSITNAQKLHIKILISVAEKQQVLSTDDKELILIF